MLQEPPAELVALLPPCADGKGIPRTTSSITFWATRVD